MRIQHKTWLSSSWYTTVENDSHVHTLRQDSRAILPAPFQVQMLLFTHVKMRLLGLQNGWLAGGSPSQEITETGSRHQAVWLSDRWDTLPPVHRSLLPGLIACDGEDSPCPWAACILESDEAERRSYAGILPQLYVVLELTEWAQEATLIPSLRQKWSSALQVTWGVGVMAYSLVSTPGCCWRRRGIPLHIVQV